MSEVNASDLTQINSVDDVFELYSGSGNQAKAGLEVELSFFDPQSSDLAVMSLSQNKVLKNSAAAVIPDHDWVHTEPTSELLEVASIADSFDNIKNVLDDTNKKIRILSDKALGLGLKRSYFQELPDRSADDLLSRIVDIDRYHIMYSPYREDMKKCVEYFAVCKSNQVSVSPYNMDHMLENVRRLYFLAPFLFLLTENSSAFSEGRKFDNNIGMSLRHDGLSGGLGVMPEYVFTAKSGAEYIENHINHVMNHPLFMYYDLAGDLQRVPSGDWSVTFNSLRARGLNIASNYYLAQSIMWPDVKIATLKNSNGDVTGHRYEARMFGVGMHQHQSALIITSALAFHDGFAVRIDKLLANYGFDNILPQNICKLLDESYKAAREHNGKFFDIKYGNGIMAEFAREFADIIEDIADDINMLEEMQPLLTICRSGCTDGKVNRLMFPTLDDIMEFQRTHDASIFYSPNNCAYDLFEKDIRQNSSVICSSISAVR